MIPMEEAEKWLDDWSIAVKFKLKLSDGEISYLLFRLVSQYYLKDRARCDICEHKSTCPKWRS